jgi:hypothetical protein
MSPRATDSGLRVAGISTDETKLLIVGDFPHGGKPANIDPEPIGDLGLPEHENHSLRSRKYVFVKRKKFNHQI